ncbi:MAG: heme A synthase [Rickettsiales bacterium]|nr:MAG: heme A synthase [Rickettsiales bacterium]
MNILNNNKNQYLVNMWLALMCFLVIIMVFIGGYTRLTDSGLSITEWNPVTGIVPPLSNNAWQNEFEKYQASPEYIKINSGMNISEFKFIYLIEFIHRLVGRVTGLTYLFGLIFFIAKNYIKLKDSGIYFFGLVLFMAQGVMGWYMVKSGLVSNPYVSHFRLAGHLMLAVFLYMIIFYQLLKQSNNFILISFKTNIKSVIFWGRLAIIILLLQIMFGAFVAGLNAGLIYNNFPLMGDSFIPQECFEIKLNLFFNNPATVQFIHRIMAYILFIVICVFSFKTISLGNIILSRAAKYLVLALIFQISLGIITLIYNVPLSFALLHQFGAILLLSAMMRVYYLAQTANI